jgi:hypothetical protein
MMCHYRLVADVAATFTRVAQVGLIIKVGVLLHLGPTSLEEQNAAVPTAGETSRSYRERIRSECSSERRDGEEKRSGSYKAIPNERCRWKRRTQSDSTLVAGSPRSTAASTSPGSRTSRSDGFSL